MRESSSVVTKLWYSPPTNTIACVFNVVENGADDEDTYKDQSWSVFMEEIEGEALQTDKQ